MPMMSATAAVSPGRDDKEGPGVPSRGGGMSAAHQAWDSDVPAAVVPAARRGELQSLAVLPTRAKNADIAESMGFSVNTVKTRLRRLYARFGAASRDEAIDRAQERGLLGPA